MPKCSLSPVKQTEEGVGLVISVARSANDAPSRLRKEDTRNSRRRRLNKFDLNGKIDR